MNKSFNNLGELIKKYSTALKLIFFFSILLFVVNQMTAILQGMTWSDLKVVLGGQRKRTLLSMIVVGLTAVLPMLVYDWVTVDILEEQGKPRIPRSQLAVAAWTTNTINNLAGFGGVVGATLRARFYGSHVESKKVVATVSKVAFFMLSGLSLLCAMTLVDITLFRTTHSYGNYWIWLLLGSFYTPSLFVFTRLKRRTLFADFPLKRVLTLFVGSFGQWLGALTCFLIIGKFLGVPVDLWQVYPLFVVATFIGMISMVPGGMGTFDVLLIIGLGALGISKEMAVVWLLYYRIFYYLVPFLTGLFSYVIQTSSKLNQFFDGLPKLISHKLAHFTLVCMVYFAGITMVLISTVPNLSNISQLFQRLLPFSFNFLDQTLNMLVGFLLLGLARGVANRVKRAYLPTLAILLFCILNTLNRGVSWKLLLFYGFLIVCIYWARKEFYRQQLVFSWGSLLSDSILYGLLFILYSVVGFYSSDRLAHGELPARFLLFPSEAIWLEGFAGLLLAAITIFLLYQYLGSQIRPGLYFDKERIDYMLARYSATPYSHLLYLKDKRNYFYHERNHDKVMFTFELQGNKFFVLGDPVGEAELFNRASRELMKHADELGYQLVFYGITDQYALLLHDLGYRFMKLGEEGSLDLRVGSPLLKERNLKEQGTNRLSAKGYWFQFYEGPISSEVMTALEKVSDEWSSEYGERYFSTGRFKREYLNSAPIGVVYNDLREVQGFITLKPINGVKATSFDLLRFKPDQPSEIRDFLLTHLIIACQERGYQLFDIGLAPMSNVGEAETAFIKERIMNTFYKYSYPLYSFQDTRNFKDHYATDWQARYLSYPRSNNLVFLMAQLYLLIERGKRRRPKPVEDIMIE